MEQYNLQERTFTIASFAVSLSWWSYFSSLSTKSTAYEGKKRKSKQNVELEPVNLTGNLRNCKMLVVRIYKFCPWLPAVPVKMEIWLLRNYTTWTRRSLVTKNRIKNLPTSASNCGSSSKWYLFRYAVNPSVPSTWTTVHILIEFCMTSKSD